MRPRIVVLALLVAALALPGLSHAQRNQSLVILAGEDLWLYDGTNLTNLTNDGHIQEAALSPFSTHIAYTTWSPMTVSAAERMGGFGGGNFTYDVKVIDLATYEITTIAVQPADASLLAAGVPDSAILRAGVTWSPDGHRLAWGELHYPSFAAETNRLVVFDFLQGNTAVLATNLPEQAGVPMPVRPWWGSAGLAFASYEFDRATITNFTRILVYSDQDGSLISATRTSEDTEARFADFLWVSGGGKDWILVRYLPSRSQFGDLIDPGTGTIIHALGVPEMVNPLAANSAAVVFNYHWNATYPDFYSWVITYPDGRQVIGENRFPVVSQVMLSGESRFPIISQVVLSPDGQTLAQVETDGQLILVGPDGQVTKGPTLEDASANLYWSPVLWRIPMPEPCGTALPARLVVGNSGVVSTNTTPNNVRSEAATGSVIGQLQPGEDFQVLAGPVCVDGMYWWQIDNYHGLVGWTAEGDSTEYWLEPTVG